MFTAGAHQHTMVPRVTLAKWKITEALTRFIVFDDQTLSGHLTMRDFKQRKNQKCSQLLLFFEEKPNLFIFTASSSSTQAEVANIGS